MGWVRVSIVVGFDNAHFTTWTSTHTYTHTHSSKYIHVQQVDSELPGPVSAHVCLCVVLSLRLPLPVPWSTALACPLQDVLQPRRRLQRISNDRQSLMLERPARPRPGVAWMRSTSCFASPALPSLWRALLPLSACQAKQEPTPNVLASMSADLIKAGGSRSVALVVALGSAQQ